MKLPLQQSFFGHYFAIFSAFILFGAPSVLKAHKTIESENPFVCYTITTPSPATQSVCVGTTGTNMTVKTTTNTSGSIRFVRFSTDQMAGSSPTTTESNFIYSYTAGTYTDIAYVTPTGSSSPYTATYTFNPDDFPNTTNTSITYYVYAVFNLGAFSPALTCNPNPAVEIQVVVKPKPTINTIASQYVCAGSATTAVTLTGSTVAGSTYSWTNSTTSIGLGANGSTTIPSFTAVNATSSPVTATVTAIATASSCVSDAQIFKMVVYPTSATMISGVAFNDYNENGIRESAEGVQEGIAVKVYNSSGTLAGSATTDVNGYWSVTGLTFGGTNKYRVEFSISGPLSIAGLKPAKNGTNNKTDVQFVSAASCNINFGVNYPSNYSSTNPVLATPCYTNGSRASNGSEAAVILYNYNDRGEGVPHQTIATLGEVGSVWGQTYNPANKKLYVSAVVKRHSDLPPAGIGAIYEIDLTTPTEAGAGTPTLWLDINAATFVNQSNTAVNLAMPVDPGIATRGLGLKTNPNRDNWAFDRVGKQGIGDIELSEDGLRLYVMDLTNRQVLCIDYATKKLIWQLAVSTPTCLGGSSDIRPWGLKEHNGVLYVGAVCSGETNKLSTQLHYYVMKCNSITAATSMSLAVDMGSSVTKQGGDLWGFWVSNPADVGITTLANGGYVVYPQAIISDIEFDKDENMIVGVMDRVGHQTGRSNYIPNVTNTNLVTGIANGDITRAVKTGSTYTNEAAPWSFFYLTAAIPNPPLDQFQGGLVVSSASGTNFAVAHMIDPFGYESAGTTWLKTADGQQQGGTNATGRLEIIPQATSVATFGKANGLGDLSLLGSPAPIQIGNYVWYDADKDGQQNATEGPLSNVTVELWKNDTKIASAVTNASGEYYFSDKNASGVTWIGTGADTALLPNMAYELKIYTKQAQLDTTELTIQDNTLNSGNDQNDSDAFMRGDSAIISLTTGVAGATDHTFDFGFGAIPCSLITMTPNPLPDGTVGTPYSAQIGAIGGTSPYQFLWLVGSTGTLPAGLSMDAAGLVSGTPTAPGSFAVKIIVKDAHECPDTLDPAAITILPACAVTPTWTQNTCNNNGTTAITSDDYFTITVSATAVSGGATGKYEVVSNGIVLNSGGTDYGTSVTVGDPGFFAADGATTYTLTVRDIDNPTCVSNVYTTTAVQNCSALSCPPKICLPVSVSRAN